MADRVIVRRGTFLDSVALMLVSRDASELEGVEQAQVVNATPLNVDLLERQAFSLPGGDEEPGPNDLLIAIRADGDEPLAAALALVEERLRRRPVSERAGAAGAAARSVTSAARRREELSLALVTVPGRHAAYECARALDAGLDVLCFSSGPSLDVEAALKARANALGLLMMGPDCGTAILGGAVLGFGNAVRPGPVGIVGASGTGIQAVACRLDAAGVGISHAIGTGGRDLSARVGGATTLSSLELLAGDAETEAIVVVAKSPDGAVAKRVAETGARIGKHVVLAFPGFAAAGGGLEQAGSPGQAGSVEHAGSLEQAAALGAAAVGARLPAPARLGAARETPGAIRGLFSGGTLRDEALAIIGAAASAGTRLERAEAGGHVLLDLGDERFTEGRPHPMIDLSLRISVLEQQALDLSVGVLLLDVVLGYGAHPDPAAELAPALARAREARRGDLTVVVSLCGTGGDPQGVDSQAERLHAAGAVVTRSNADAAELALAAAGLGSAVS
jgi:FdrA protein